MVNDTENVSYVSLAQVLSKEEIIATYQIFTIDISYTKSVLDASSHLIFLNNI